MPQIQNYIKAYLIAAIGVALFHFAKLPLPFLLGPITACLLAALCGVQFKTVSFIGNAMRTVLGVAIGATVTLALLINMLAIWHSLLMVLVMISVIGLIGTPYFRYLWKYDVMTAYYASMPGGLQDMILFGKEAGANVRTLSLVHATRVLLIVMILPFLLINFWQVDLHNLPGLPANQIPLNQIIIMIVAGILGWRIAKKIGLFGASILGPLLLASLLSLTGILHYRPPAEAIFMAQYFIGVGIGSKYIGITIQEFRRDIIASLGFTILLMLITFVFVGIVLQFDVNTPLNILLAFTPGGQAEITVLALIVGADLSFVIAHHLLRIIAVIILSPIIMKLFNKP